MVDAGVSEKNMFMKKTFTLLSFMVFLTVFAQAQFDVGQRLLGGNASFNTGKNENVTMNNGVINTGTSVSINPTLGTFRKPNVLTGIGLTYGSYFQRSVYTNNSYITKVKTTSLGISAFRQRFVPLATNLFFTIQTTGEASYRFGKETSVSNGKETVSNIKGHRIGLSVAPGVSYKMTNRLLFDVFLSNLLAIGYNSEQTKAAVAPRTEKNSSNFYVSSGLSNISLSNVGIGFRWLLK